jgi:hypothetical protein
MPTREESRRILSTEDSNSPGRQTAATSPTPRSDKHGVLMKKSEHEICVDVWIEEQAQGLAADKLVPLFNQALRVLWQRTERILGDVTVRALADRAFHTTAGQSLFSMFKLEASGIRCVGFGGGGGDPEELVVQMRLLLVEFLTVLGSLTAEILTPALHQDLRAVTAQSRVDTSRGRATVSSKTTDEENG